MSSRSVCQDFVRGYCQFGRRCRQSHNLRGTPYERRHNRDTHSVRRTLNPMQRLSSVTMGRHANLVVVSPQTSTAPVQQIPQNDSDLVFTRTSSSSKDTNVENSSEVDHNFMIKCMEDEFKCNICQEIFIKPTVLNCTHAFCQGCINSWTRIKNRCPLCRAFVKNKTYCRSIDTFLDKIMPILSKELQSKRQSRIEEYNMTRHKYYTSVMET